MSKSLRIDGNLNIVKNGFTQLVDYTRVDLQLLFFFLKYVEVGDLPWAPDIGFDRQGFLELCKIGSVDNIETFFRVALQGTDINLSNVTVEIDSEEKILYITFLLTGYLGVVEQDTISMAVSTATGDMSFVPAPDPRPECYPSVEIIDDIINEEDSELPVAEPSANVLPASESGE